jgi:hypothetical protein
MEPQNEKTRQKAGFSGVPEILKAFSGTLYGAGTRNRTRELLITSGLSRRFSMVHQVTKSRQIVHIQGISLVSLFRLVARCSLKSPKKL